MKPLDERIAEDLMLKRIAKGARLRAQATHTDTMGALYKYVNGKLFHFRICHYLYTKRPISIPCWGFINLPASHQLVEIQ